MDPTLELVRRQVSNLASPTRELVDAATEAVVKRLVFDESQPLDEAGMVACLFPEGYSESRHYIPNIVTPCFHSVTFRVKKNVAGAHLSFLLNFTIPRVSTLFEKVVDSDGSERWQRYGSTLKIIGGERYTGWEKPDEPLKLELGEQRFGIITLQRKEVGSSMPSASTKEVIVTPEIRLSYEITASKMQDSLYNVTVVVRNKSRRKIRSVLGTIYSVSMEIVAEGAQFVPIKVGEVEVPARSINTHCFLQGNKLFCTPLIILDLPRIEPSLGPELRQLTSQDLLLQEMALLSTEEKQELLKRGWIDLLSKIFESIAEALPHIKHLYRWQFDAIQIIISRLLKEDTKPLILRAPTGKGKTLVFAFAAILTALHASEEGTKVILTFPTRALTTQQFNEFIAITFRLNAKNQKRIRIALYMGKGGTIGSLDARSISEGEPIPHITQCPACNGDNIVAHKPSEDTVIPQCASCGVKLGFVTLSDRSAEECPPDIVIATIDKLAYAVSQNVYSHTLFGAESRRCQACGIWHSLSFKKYLDTAAVCRRCGSSLSSNTTKSAIKLIVFDEVHTLYGTTGNLTAHFISLFKRLNKKYGNGGISIIGATATVANENILIQHLTDNVPDVFPPEERFDQYFNESGELQYRFVVAEPLNTTTRTLILRGIKAYDQFIRVVKRTFPDVATKYEQQFVFVTRKRDGSTLLKTITEAFTSPPETAFVSGDDSSRQIAVKTKGVKEHRYMVVIATKIYSLGMDFGDLNVLHFFGVPDTIVDLIQIIGRTGRQGFPALIFLHLYPPNPRDNFVYEFFSEIVRKPGLHFEPTPINSLNRYAVIQSSFNIISAINLADCNKLPQIRYCDAAYNFYVTQRNAERLLREALEVYHRSFASPEEMSDIQQILIDRLRSLLLECKGRDVTVVDLLNSRRLMLTSLRGEARSVNYAPVTHYPVIDYIEADSESEDSLLIEEARAPEDSTPSDHEQGEEA
jgi:ATP-dependent helicase YprA (DUF1998 family)